MGPFDTMPDSSLNDTAMMSRINNVSADKFNCLTGPRRSAYRSARRRGAAPYPRTPANCRQLFTRLSKKQIPVDRPRSKSVDKTIVTDDPWKVVVNKSFITYSCSPHYLLHLDDKSLKQYSRHLSAHVVSQMSKTVACVEDEANHASVLLFKDPASGNGSTGIEITLSQTSGKGVSRVVLSALLYSSSRQSCVVDTDLDDKFLSMPILLVKGSIRLTECLISWWQSQFDCVISRRYFTSIDLCWMVAMFSGYITDKSSKPVVLVYNFPKTVGVEGFTTVKYSINSQDCFLLWKSIHPEGVDDTFNTTQVMAFVKSLEAHFYHHFKIILSALKLVSIGTQLLSVSADGKVKFFSGAHVEQILAAVEQFQAH